MVTSVIELADVLYKKAKYYEEICIYDTYREVMILTRIVTNANDLGLPLLVVQQLLKGTDYEQYLS